ncbi:MAG TPA: NAD-dependent epimerase/dehydratase family protein [Aggregatilinea sp.]|uniref:SDR family oxidoreductase n=1 Tax=Aggregatilinea sp. TaxID=2806333 RepID=UPI002CCE56A2|nr:NAD-dependent epimerase/dehydratase family protein [Aggregatilinea sp.]HML21690.1 NAD-dependent epimerase/dehydratase family protein [Aggregatilinea sp.]
MILITGATGLVGRYLVSQLAQEGWPVRVLTEQRRAGRLGHLGWPDSVQIVHGDLADTDSLHQALQGVHSVFHLASAQWWGRRRDLERVDVQGTRNLVAVARSARIGRIYFLSQLGAEPSSAYLLMRVKGQVEGLVRNSGIPYTILRCGLIFGPEDRFVNGIAMLLRSNPVVFFQPGKGESLLHPLYVKDLVAALEHSLQSIDLVDQTIEIGGAEYVSYHEMVRTVMRVSGAHRIILPVPPHTLRVMTNMVNRVVPRWPMTPQWFDILAGNRTAKLGNLYDYCGVRPVRFEDTLLTYMPQRHYLPELARFMLRRSY